MTSRNRNTDTPSANVQLVGDPKTVEITKADPEIKCSFCRRCEINPEEWGLMLKLDDIVVHHFCLLFSSSVQQNGTDEQGIFGFMTADIKREVRRGNRLRCAYCKRTNATIGCGVSSCKLSFHYTCGYEANCLFQFHDQFYAYCPKHKKRQKVPSTVSRECPVCLIGVDNLDEAVWPPCCGKSLFHRACLLHAAKAAGYFFKCPLCNSNSKKFLLAMKTNGVFVPEQDAAWETEPNAFQELLTKYSRCDAKLCGCPGGREFTSKTKNWSLILCGSCGGSATHAKCSNFKGSSSNWKCRGCRNIFMKSGDDREYSDDSSTTDSSDCSDEEDVLATLPYITTPIRSQPPVRIESDDSVRRRGILICPAEDAYIRHLRREHKQALDHSIGRSDNNGSDAENVQEPSCSCPQLTSGHDEYLQHLQTLSQTPCEAENQIPDPGTDLRRLERVKALFRSTRVMRKEARDKVRLEGILKEQRINVQQGTEDGGFRDAARVFISVSGVTGPTVKIGMDERNFAINETKVRSSESDLLVEQGKMDELQKQLRQLVYIKKEKGESP